MEDDNGNPMFAFQDLDYIPFGFSSNEAPYIETGPGTMRAAATLMRLNVDQNSTTQNLRTTTEEHATTVVCDLGCGDGEFRTYNSTLPFSS
jgi:tRNA G46 methylase TrmB